MNKDAEWFRKQILEQDDSPKVNFKSPPPLQKVVQLWSEHRRRPMVKKKAMNNYVFFYPIRRILPYREYIWNRQNARQEAIRINGERVLLDGDLKWDALYTKMKKGGWTKKHPIIMQVGRDGNLKVGEGNHRLAIAKEIGIKKVPVRFHFQRRVNNGHPVGNPNRPERISSHRDVSKKVQYTSLDKIKEVMNKRKVERKKRKRNRQQDKENNQNNDRDKGKDNGDGPDDDFEELMDMLT